MQGLLQQQHKQRRRTSMRLACACSFRDKTFFCSSQREAVASKQKSRNARLPLTKTTMSIQIPKSDPNPENFLICDPYNNYSDNLCNKGKITENKKVACYLFIQVWFLLRASLISAARCKTCSVKLSRISGAFG